MGRPAAIVTGIGCDAGCAHAVADVPNITMSAAKTARAIFITSVQESTPDRPTVHRQTMTVELIRTR